jgi:hypothetical protein
MTKPTGTPTGTGLKRVAIFIMVACLSMGSLLYIVFGGAESEDPRTLLALPFLLGYLAGMLLYFRARRLVAKALAEDSHSPLSGSTQSVLYLRAFDTDPTTITKVVASSLSTEEEQLAAVLRPFGDLIAVGRPGERLPLPGAVRMYAGDSEWRDLVLDRMRSASLVVIRAGSGHGLLWEVDRAFATLPPERVLILVLHLPLKDYRTFADQVRQATHVSLPTLGRAGLAGRLGAYNEWPSHASPGFVAFGNNWTPAFLPLPFTLGQTGFNDLRKPFNLALRPVFEQHAVAWRPMSRLR